jgi:hypothetical protein
MIQVLQGVRVTRAFLVDRCNVGVDKLQGLLASTFIIEWPDTAARRKPALVLGFPIAFAGMTGHSIIEVAPSKPGIWYLIYTGIRDSP